MQDKLSLGAERFIQAVNEFIFVEDQPEKADVIFVPGSRKIENAIRTQICVYFYAFHVYMHVGLRVCVCECVCVFKYSKTLGQLAMHLVSLGKDLLHI